MQRNRLSSLPTNPNVADALFIVCEEDLDPHVRSNFNFKLMNTAIVIGYLMKRCNYNLRNAFIHVKKLRPAIGPHYYLRLQLIQYEMHLFGGSNSLDMESWRQLEYKMVEEANKETM